jgi:hypothetical protein
MKKQPLTAIIVTPSGAAFVGWEAQWRRGYYEDDGVTEWLPVFAQPSEHPPQVYSTATAAEAAVKRIKRKAFFGWDIELAVVT